VAGSFPIFDHVVRQLIGWIGPARALDLGAGAGKYGRLIAEVAPACERVGVEISAGYAERFALNDIYHRVDIDDAAHWWQRQEEEAFDLVVIGDCLEHMPKSQGLDLLNAMVYRCGWLVALAPEFIIQGPVDGQVSEVHRSVWSERDLRWHDLWAWDNTRAMTLLLLRGYRPSPVSIDQIVGLVNDANLSLLDFDGQSAVRPCRLRLVDHAREVAYRPR
jgi:SAM-dependent methyltransferase